MNQIEALKVLTSSLKSIKLKGGSPFDYIENENEPLYDNYEIALTALGFDGTHAERDFDNALEALFDSIETNNTVKIVVEMKGYTDKYEGLFGGIICHTVGYPTWKDRENKTNQIIDKSERIRLFRKDDVVTECPTIHVLRYWYKTKWVYISHK